MLRNLCLSVALAMAAPVMADVIDLGDYLASMDRAPVQLTGYIRYDASERIFTFYDENRRAFGATVDAGRDQRERIENSCENSRFLVSVTDLCRISGGGTIEIDGSSIRISIEQVDELIPPGQ